MMFPESVTQPSSGPTLTQTFRVTGIFHVDFAEYDERLAFASLTAVQRVSKALVAQDLVVFRTPRPEHPGPAPATSK